MGTQLAGSPHDIELLRAVRDVDVAGAQPHEHGDGRGGHEGGTDSEGEGEASSAASARAGGDVGSALVGWP